MGNVLKKLGCLQVDEAPRKGYFRKGIKQLHFAVLNQHFSIIKYRLKVQFSINLYFWGNSIKINRLKSLVKSCLILYKNNNHENRRVTVVDKNGYEKVHKIALTESNEDTVSTASFGNFMSGKTGFCILKFKSP